MASYSNQSALGQGVLPAWISHRETRLSAAPRAADSLPLISRPEDVGLSPERLERITTVTRDHIDSRLLGGAVIVIAREGKIAYFKNLGYRDRAANALMPPEAIFRLASMTKPFVSVAAMILQEEGRFQITDPVSRYLPELAQRQERT